jgi:hypothetical protein
MANNWRSFKENWVNISRENGKLKAFFMKFGVVAFFGVLLVAGIFSIIYVIYSLAQILLRNFGNYHTQNLILFFILSAYLTMFLFFSLVFVYSFFSSKKRNWFWLSISLIIFAFIFGLFMIDYAIGNKDLRLNLIESGKYNGGIIACTNSYAFAEGSPVFCKLEKMPYDIDNYRIGFTYFTNGSFEDISLENNTRFDAPYNVSYIRFDIIGTTKTGEGFFMSSGLSYHFNNKEELLDTQKNMIRDFLALFAILFITIPIAVINFKNLWRDN